MTETARRYAGQSAEERDAQRRERLRAACRKLIGSDGYPATTIERICSTAGVSTRHFYQHYDSKEAAFIDLYESITTASYAAAAQSLADTVGQDFKDRVPQAFLAYIRPMVQDVQTARIAFVEIIGVSPRTSHIASSTSAAEAWAAWAATAFAGVCWPRTSCATRFRLRPTGGDVPVVRARCGVFRWVGASTPPVRCRAPRRTAAEQPRSLATPEVWYLLWCHEEPSAERHLRSGNVRGCHGMFR